MSLVTMNQLLNDARNRKYAVGGFNVFNFETLSAVVEVAEELKTPLVLGLPERIFKFVDVDILGVAMVRAAHRASVPIAVHLDHAHSFEGIMKAIRWGFTSIMFDGSSLAFSENLKRTKEAAKIAHALGLSIEGELGYLHERPATAEEAADFIANTKVDALAIGVAATGNEEDLAVSYIGNIAKTVNIPLVLHGGMRSKFTREQYREYILSGISKINVATDMSLAAGETLTQELSKKANSNYIYLMSAVKKGVKESVRKYMLNFDCISKAI